MKSAAIINMILNGLLALFSYLSRPFIPFSEASIDILIAVGIIAFLNSWLLIGSARGDVAKRNVDRSNYRGPRLPHGGGVRALIITLLCVIVFGGLVLDVPFFLISPSGMSNWVYIVFKTLYTGVAAALAVGMSIYSVLSDENRK